MQNLNWNDLKVLLAVHRTGTISAAAMRLRIDQTTVSRRLRALEATAGASLTTRLPGAKIGLTEVGQVIVQGAEQMEQTSLAMEEALGAASQQVQGTVRLTAVPILINRVLVPALYDFMKQHPDLTIEMAPEARDLNLTHREADLALRLGRPRKGGTQVLARRIGTLTYGVFEANTSPKADCWITYDALMAWLPQAKYVQEQAGDAAGLKVNDAETAVEAAAAGLGRAVLPACVGQADRRLREIPPTKGVPAPPDREVWLLSHAEQRGFRAIQAVTQWLDTLPLR